MEDCSNQEPPSASQKYEQFLTEFLTIYKENPILWDKSDPNFTNRNVKSDAYNKLLIKCKEYFPDANIDFVKTKIQTLKGTFRREYRKVQLSKNIATSEKEIYIPSLWYYNLLLFTVGENCNTNSDFPQENTKVVYFWDREQTVCLIEVLKKYPILYLQSSENCKNKRVMAYKNITKDMIAQTGRSYDYKEIKSKIISLKDQYRRECRSRLKGRTRGTGLWCYDLLSFLKNSLSEKNDDVKDDFEESGDENEFMEDGTTENEYKDEKIIMQTCEDDIFDTIGKNVAIKLRDMNDDQRKYAENLINELMYNGLMEQLTADSRLSIDGL